VICDHVVISEEVISEEVISEEEIVKYKSGKVAIGLQVRASEMSH
jgi:hypothetical protein